MTKRNLGLNRILPRIGVATPVLAIGALGAALAAGSPAQAASLELKQIAAKVVIVAEPRSDVAVTIVRSNPKLPLRVRRGESGLVVVDSGKEWWPELLSGHITSCHMRDEGETIHVGGAGTFREEDLPELLVRVPMDAKVSSSGAVIGSLPKADSLNLSIAGCDRWTIGDIRGRLRLETSGEGRVRAGAVGRADIDVSGSAKVAVRKAEAGLAADISGAGDVHAGEVGGELVVDIAGSSHVDVDGGHIGRLKGSIAGSGEVNFGGTADRVKMDVAGSGHVTVAHVTGQPGGVDQRIMGAGEIDVGQ